MLIKTPHNTIINIMRSVFNSAFKISHQLTKTKYGCMIHSFYAQKCIHFSLSSSFQVSKAGFKIHDS